jgi:hypothetical protein
MQSFLFIFIMLLLLALAAGFLAAKTHQKLEKAEQSLHRYKRLSSQEDYQKALHFDIESKKREILQLKDEEEKLTISIDNLRGSFNELKEEKHIESFGFYQSKYDFISAGSYSSLLKNNKDEQRKMIKENTAAICHSSWSVGGSEKEGEKMVNNFRKLVLTIFNSECDILMSRVKYSTDINSSESKLEKLFDKLNKISKVIHCEISGRYFSLKKKELYLQYQIECEKQEGIEREKVLREEIKERKKLDKLMKEAEEAEDRENRFQQELENALKEQELSYGAEKERLEVQVQQLRQKVEQARSEKDKANAQAAMTKAGYIYVISNVGSFGRDVYRICMTKKSGDPDDYVNVMSPIVPFPFDIHLKFLSEEALDTLARLQSAFSGKRVNKARNERRGFFKVSLEEILQVVEEIKKETGVIKSVHFEQAPSAYEYRRTQAIERSNQNSVFPSVSINNGSA